VHSLEPYSFEKHSTILYAAALSGIDFTPVVVSERFVGYGNTKYGFGPACVLDLAGTEHVAEPHVTWFPWTTPANRVVNFKWAMNFLAQSREILLTVQKDQIKFFEHFAKKGVLRKVGYLENMPIVGEIHMYQYKRSTQ
jgi:hypothetical protein